MNPELIMKMMGNVNPELNKLLKRAEKHFIKSYLAPQMKSKAKQHQSKVQSNQKKIKNQLREQSQYFEKTFQTSTKGKWVDCALIKFSKNQNKLESI